MRDPLILPLVSIISGILLGRTLILTPAGAAWPIAAFGGLALIAAWQRSKWLKHGCLTLALVFAGAFTEAWHVPGPPPEIDAGPREIVILAGCVVEPSSFSPGREQFTLELEPGARARVTLPLDGPPENGAASWPRFRYGQSVEIEARVRKPRNYQNPGAFDYVRYLARMKIFWTATMIRGSRARVLESRCGSRFWSAVYQLRETALERLAKLYAGDQYTAAMMRAILVGDDSALEDVWTDTFRKTGTMHALVISGAHVAALAGMLLFLLRLLAVPELFALLFTALAGWLYALVTGFSPPVIRAAAGLTLYGIARFLFRRVRPLNLLAAIAIAYVMVDPGSLFDASFQLSFLAVAALAAIAQPILGATLTPLAGGLRGLANTDRDAHLQPAVTQFRVEIRLAAEAITEWIRLPLRMVVSGLALLMRILLYAAGLLVISFAIQIGLALPMAEYFHRFSFTGLTANLAVVPLLEAAVPAGFLAIMTGWHWIASLAKWLLALAARTADFHARIEPNWRVADPPLFVGAGFIVALISFAVSMRQSPARAPWVRWSLAVTVAALFALLVWQPWDPDVARGTLELNVIDVGQGDSLFLTFPQGGTMLIDGGGILQYGRKQYRPRLDIGEDVVSPFLWNRGIRHIDIVAVTHAHADHTGGIGSLLSNFQPEEIWTGANPSPELIAKAEQLGIPVLEKQAPSVHEFSGAIVQVVSPFPGLGGASTGRAPGNNDSLVLRISYGERSFLLTGDIERAVESQLAAQGRLEHADVLKVGHHGSKTSSTPEFLAPVSPSLAAISAGYENSFGHPHPDVIERLTGRHTTILRTDRDGLLTIRTDGRNLWYGSAVWNNVSGPRGLRYPPGVAWPKSW